ncbi:Bromodomain-containing protein [Trichodelitschia bisporula]|uniref:Bromodomain-containing protein n=1 Tax=Trichodelitschia bisporula TaxID=703511 RepID=A0A6G1IA22_9PEZI|nr:Bromodomain-containing protein [Trichodelitschia bisporula]
MVDSQPTAHTEKQAVPSTSENATNSKLTPIGDGSGGTPSLPVMPSYGSTPMTDAEYRNLVDVIRKTKKVKTALPFLHPVDAVALNIPTYPQIIKTPMDLSTIEKKLKDSQYPTIDAFMADIETMVQNAITFNGSQHMVAQQGMNLRAYIMKLVGYLDQNGLPIIRRLANSRADRPKREIHPPKKDLPFLASRPKKKKGQIELKFCETVIKEIHKQRHKAFSWPFLTPVDPVALNIPTYLKIIKKPMDFGTIETKLTNGEYSSAKEFHADSKLVFQNCAKFNPRDEPVYGMGQQLEKVFDDKWATKDQWIADNTPPSEPPSDAEDEDEEDEDETPSSIQRMMQIQEEIAALTAEAFQITNGVKASKNVKARGKTVKTSKAIESGGRKNSKTSGAASKSSSKSKPKYRKLTMDQKRVVSEGIQALDEGQMRKAVQIIRNGVPALRGVNDDELELDIDEIPDPVLSELYDFVKRARPRDLSEDDDYEEPRAVTKTSTLGRRKNKPMSAREQESKIEKVKAQLQRFQASDHSPGESCVNPEPDRADRSEVAQDDEGSSDDEDSESSEEE